MSELPASAPRVNHETAPYWDATAQGRIDLPRCRSCDLVIWYPRAICPDCQSSDLEWQTMSGDASVYSFTVTRAGVGSKWRDHLPIVVAYVQLAEGPIMLTNIVDCDPESVEIGMALRPVFHDTGEGPALVRFTPA